MLSEEVDARDEADHESYRLTAAMISLILLLISTSLLFGFFVWTFSTV
jgi:hypothetical protein